MDKPHTALQTQIKRTRIQRLVVSQRSTLLNLKKSLDPAPHSKELPPPTSNMLRQTAKSFQKLRKVSIDRRISKPTPNVSTNRGSKSTTGLIHDSIRLMDFKQLHKIGEGSYSTVKIFVKDGCQFACKIFRKPLAPQILENVKNEIEVLKKLNHENMVRLHYTFQDTNHLYIVLEFIQGRTLAGFLKKNPSEEQIKSIARQAISALGCLHSNNIAHRDLKLDNIMIDEANDNRVVLIDFGFATPCDRKLKMFCGTPSYMCPEIVKRSWYSGVKADMWALGVIIYRMVTGAFPFKGTSEMQVFEKICKSKYDEHKLSIDQSAMLKNLLCKLENERHRCSQVSSCSWLSSDELIKAVQSTKQVKSDPCF